MISQHSTRLAGLALRVGLYVFFALAGFTVFGWLLGATGSYLVAAALGGFLTACTANALMLRLFERASLSEIGLGWNPASRRHVILGLAGGIGAACIVLGLPLLAGAARFTPTPGVALRLTNILFLMIVLVFGAAGEEMLFRGYAFQAMLGVLGPFATIIPVGVLFGLLHAANPEVTRLGILNTCLWGVLLGYSFLRSGDLWLPIGLHLGWNWTLPWFGVTLSGFRMEVTGYTLDWRISPAWSGGAYGPEGGLLTTLVVLVLFIYLWKIPVVTQHPLLIREFGEV